MQKKMEQTQPVAAQTPVVAPAIVVAPTAVAPPIAVVAPVPAEPVVQQPPRQLSPEPPAHKVTRVSPTPETTKPLVMEEGR